MVSQLLEFLITGLNTLMVILTLLIQPRRTPFVFRRVTNVPYRFLALSMELIPGNFQAGLVEGKNTTGPTKKSERQCPKCDETSTLGAGFCTQFAKLR